MAPPIHELQFILLASFGGIRLWESNETPINDSHTDTLLPHYAAYSIIITGLVEFVNGFFL